MALRNVSIVVLIAACGVGGFFLIFNDRGAPPNRASFAESENQATSWPAETESAMLQGQPRLAGSASHDAPAAALKKRPLIPRELRDQVRFLEMMGAEDPERGKLILEIAQAWANIDPLGVLAWAATLELSDGILAVTPAVIPLIRASPSEAFKAVNSMDALSPQLRDRARFLVLDSWGQSDFKGSLEATGTLEDNELRLEIQNHLLVQHSAHDPAGAAETLKDLAHSVDDDSLFSSTATTIAREFIRREYQNRESAEIEGQPANFDERHDYAGDAIKWAFELPKGQLRTAALRGAIGAWTVANPEGASGWLDDYPAGSERDAMIEEMTILARSPEISFLWAVEAMTPGEARNRVLVRSAIGWIDVDHEAAWRAIESNPDLSARERALIYDSWKAFEPFRETE